MNDEIKHSDIVDESVWLGQNFFDDEVLEKRLSPAANVKSGVKHIAFETDDPKLKWLADSSDLVLLYHATFHSLFMRWAVAGNGLCVAAEKYKSWNDEKSFRIHGYRVGSNGFEPVTLHEYPGGIASELHSGTVPMLAGWGFCSMFSCLEEMIFFLFKVFYRDNPKNLIQAPEFKALKVIYSKRKTDEASEKKWADEFENRFNNWRVKKVYQGLKKSFLNYASLSKVEFQNATVVGVERWAETINIVAEIRNSFIHGASKVSATLSDLCKSPDCFGFSFVEGEPFLIDMNHLAILEMFLDEFTTMLNHGFADTYARELGLDLKDQS